MIFLHYHTAFKALDRYVKTYNSKTEDLSLQIRQSVSATAKELIRLYGSALIKANGIEKVDKDNLPSLRTNNVQLAKLSHSSTRTVQRHIQKLMEAGVITRKVWHGSNASYELWINPDILLVMERISPDEAKKAQDVKSAKEAVEAQKGHFEKEQTTKRLHTDAGNTRNTNNIIIDVVNSMKIPSNEGINSRNVSTGNTSKRREHALTSPQAFSGYTGNTLAGHTGEKVAIKSEKAAGRAAAVDKCELSEKAHKDAGEKGRHRVGEENGDKSPENPARAATSFYAERLWKLAKNVLYKDVYLTERQELAAKRLLRQWYEPVSENRLTRVHEIYTERIFLVKKFIQKDPENRFVQLPDRYFDPTNRHGFTGTKKWWEVQEKRKQEVQLKLILNAQIRRYLKNEKKDTAKRRPSLEMYRDCEQRIGKLGDPILLKQFHASILSSHSNLQLN
ncbi:MAG: winged helix-turn-helix domain-containing protein [Cytophagales bacterium]|nr:winged helix-turn-helix domain-containing protein [Cytophagales bacterium]